MLAAMNRSTTHTALRRALAAAGLLVLLAAPAACGSDADGERASGQQTAADDIASLEGGDDGGDDGDDSDREATDDTSDDTEDEPAADPEDAMLEFAECMRDHGVDYPDPQVDGDGPTRIQVVGDPEDPDFREADEACHPILEDMMGSFEPPSPEEQAEMQEQMLQFAECMREQGIDFPDPVMGDDGMISVRIGDDSDAERAPVPMDDPAFQAAQEACGMPMMGGGGGE